MVGNGIDLWRVRQVNRRTDDYGGSARKRLTLLFRIIDAIRLELPQEKGFCLGVKLNSSDYVVRCSLFLLSPTAATELFVALWQKGGLTVRFTDLSTYTGHES